MATRARTRFGVVIPPWVEDKPKNPITIEFVLTGKIPSKKNRSKPSFNFSWVIGQIRKFHKERKKETPLSIGESVNFMIKLVKNIKPFIYKPPDIIAWEDAAKMKIAEQAAEWSESYKKRCLIFPISKCQVLIKHYWADEYIRDNSNRAESIHDLLVDAGIIVDDNYKCLFENTSKAKCFKDEIVNHITLIKVTAYKW